MNVTVADVRYRPGFEPVTIVVRTPIGEMRLQTVQATLTARAGGGNWGDTEARGLVQDTLDQLYPDAGFLVS